ncbi:MAG: hemolysin, partial [Candidatus Aminicenantes bacterium]|nr:hemolysin [Candidatus Aminicenantes bacterium]NIT26786.1 hemolysin [Candidatus Aminicenantes bacterium]
MLRNDLLLAQAGDQPQIPVAEFLRELPVVIDVSPLSRAFTQLLEQRANVLLVVDEYGGIEGLLTLEDVLETITGL